MIDKKPKIIMLGAPGIGKGTISLMLIERNDLKHISTGNLFRAAIKAGDEQAKQLQDIMSSGQLIPDSITNNIAKNAILEVIKEDKGFILDGYPRTHEQADFLSNLIDIDYVFYLDSSKDVLINRISGRRMCRGCDAIYNINTNILPKQEGICDKCGSELYQRKDDSEETAHKRIHVYLEETQPLVAYYSKLNKLVKIDASQDIEAIYNDILKVCQK